MSKISSRIAPSDVLFDKKTQLLERGKSATEEDSLIETTTPLNEIEKQTIFLTLNDSNLYREFRRKQKASLYWPTVFVNVILFMIVSGTRGSVYKIFQLGIYFNITHFVLIMVALIHGFFYGSHICLNLFEKDSVYHKWSEYIIFQFLNGHIEDCAVVSATFVSGLFLLSRVEAGVCAANANLFDQQLCNPYGAQHSIPLDQEFFLFIIPVISQIYIRGCSRWGVFISHVVSLSFTLWSLVLVDGYPEMWTVLYSFFLVLTSYELQRAKLENFLQTKEVVFKQTAMVEREMEHELEMLALSSKSAAFEKEQLRNVCGNVAHDLKTPIQSIAMGIDNLKADFLIVPKVSASLSKIAIHTPKGSHYTQSYSITNTNTNTPKHRSTSVGVMDADSLLDVISASCAFMTMAINRAIDFTKATSNVNLIPAMSSFHMQNALQLPLACIRSLQTDIVVELTPLPPIFTTVPDIISDRHWFCENVLCLLSNAVKYSDSGTVTLSVELSDTPKRKFPLSMLSEQARHFSDIRESGTNVSFCEDDAGKSDGMSVRSSFSRRNGKYVMVSVEDCGIGVPTEVANKLFKPFAQTQRLAGGTGLGLFSLTERMKALGGACGLQNRSDGKQGSVFWFSFPYRPDCPDVEDNGMEVDEFLAINEAEEQQESPNTSERKPTTYSRTSNVIDDDKNVVASEKPPITKSLRVDTLLQYELPSNQKLNVNGNISTPSHASKTTSRHADNNNNNSNNNSGIVSNKSSNRSNKDQSTKPKISPTKSRKPTRPLRILLVDDSLAILKMTHSTLEKLGHQVVSAKNGARGLAEMQRLVLDNLDGVMDLEVGRGSVGLDLVLMDLQMPVMDGIEATKRFRELEQQAYSFSNRNTPCVAQKRVENNKNNTNDDKISIIQRRRLPIIGMSANSDNETKSIALSMGMDSFMAKPFSISEFEDILESLDLLLSPEI